MVQVFLKLGTYTVMEMNTAMKTAASDSVVRLNQ